MYTLIWHTLTKEYKGGRMIVIISIITLFVALLEGLNIGLLIPLLESFDNNTSEAHWISTSIENLCETLGLKYGLPTILGILGFMVLIMAVLKYSRLVLVERTREKFIAWIRVRSMDRLMQSDFVYLHNQRLGKLSDTLTTQANTAGGSIYHITDLAANVGVVVAYLCAAFLISPLLTLISLIALIMVTIAVQYYISQARIIASQRITEENNLQAKVIEYLSGMRVIKSFGLDLNNKSEFLDQVRLVGRHAFRLGENQSKITVSQELALFVVIGAIVFIGVAVLSLKVTAIIALLFVLYRLTPRVSNINVRRQNLAVSLAALSNIKTTMNEAAQTPLKQGGKKLIGIGDSIEFQEVTFSYNDSDSVLENISFSIKKRSMTAIVGPSGCGKSTLLDLILGFLSPDSGQIRVDGIDISKIDLHTWRQSVGVVDQDIFLFNDTVQNNISLKRTGVSEQEVINTAIKTSCDEFIRKLPDGYGTTVGDRGWNLSGGQRQRLALARATLLNPELLILDEATSSLDSESELIIQKYLEHERESTTLIVVAHRMSTIRNADNIIVLSNKGIVEQGTWDDLIGQGGVLARYTNIQSFD